MGVTLKADKLAHRVIPWGLVLFGLARGEELPMRYAWLCLMATAVCVLRGCGACIRPIRLIRLIRLWWGAMLYPVGLPVPLFGLAQSADLPLGNAAHTAPQIKNTVFTVFSVFSVSAARRV